jgi:hypothetical protein
MLLNGIGLMPQQIVLAADGDIENDLGSVTFRIGDLHVTSARSGRLSPPPRHRRSARC